MSNIEKLKQEIKEEIKKSKTSELLLNIAKNSLPQTISQGIRDGVMGVVAGVSVYFGVTTASVATPVIGSIAITLHQIENDCGEMSELIDRTIRRKKNEQYLSESIESNSSII